MNSLGALKIKHNPYLYFPNQTRPTFSLNKKFLP